MTKSVTVTVTLGWLPTYDSELWSWMNESPELNFDDSFNGTYRQFCVSLAMKEQAGQLYTIFGGPDAEVVGCAAILPEIVGYSYRTAGFIIAPQHRGKGYGTEALKSIITGLVNYSETGNIRMSAEVFSHNMAIRHVLEKCGFRWEGSHADKSLQAGVPVSTETYGLVIKSQQLALEGVD